MNQLVTYGVAENNILDDGEETTVNCHNSNNKQQQQAATVTTSSNKQPVCNKARSRTIPEELGCSKCRWAHNGCAECWEKKYPGVPRTRGRKFKKTRSDLRVAVGGEGGA